MVELLSVSNAVLDNAGYYPNLAAGTYRLRVRTRSGLAQGDDKTSLSSFDDVGRSELGMYELSVD